MVRIVKKKIGNNDFYYLRHHTKDKEKEVYLGKKIPDNIEEIKKEFLMQFYRNDWLSKIKEISTGYKKYKKKVPKTVLQKQIEDFAVIFTYNTQKIEGSTLTLQETTNLLLYGITPATKPKDHMVETEMHKKIFDEMLYHKNKISLATVLYWHKAMFDKTKPDIAGKIRDYHVRVGQSKTEFPDPNVIPLMLKEFFRWYNKNKKILNPAELAARAHLRFVSIHPFGDGNGRVSRLIMNKILDEFGYPMLDVEYGKRVMYYSALEKSQITDNDFYFVRWFMSRYIKAHHDFYHNV
ncbi:MAG: Fic family protein [Nitrosopumilus sp.]|nr:Fic family protein [Nitrosopumilus sp.]MDH3852871.1 Fic family protein [Nitrosopumilus sp.]